MENLIKYGTIREAASDLLCAISYYEDLSGGSLPVPHDSPDAGSVGYPYKKIVKSIKRHFPNSKTSVSCLRWYAVQIRNCEKGYEGLRLPRRRPRK